MCSLELHLTLPRPYTISDSAALPLLHPETGLALLVVFITVILIVLLRRLLEMSSNGGAEAVEAREALSNDPLENVTDGAASGGGGAKLRNRKHGGKDRSR